MASAARKFLVDIHSHVYLPRYASLLRSRATVPLIKTLPSGEERLVILDNEPSGGRPVGPQYWSRDEKLKFMDKHGIDITIVSTANPWLDFLPPSDATTLAEQLNEDLEEYCATSPTLPATGESSALRRLYAFGLLPLVPEIPITAVLASIAQLKALPHVRGVILGTQGLGKGLDDPKLDKVWGAIADAGLVVFLHPHYGVGSNSWGDVDNGHVLPLALGFPFETTTATTRLILSGVLDRHPTLKLLLAHSGGALPALSSRLASCITHDPVVANRLKHDARYYLGKLYLDAVSYGPEEMAFASDVVGRAGSYASPPISSPSALEDRRSLGSQQMLFGTDHPFFPPLQEQDKWTSVTENLKAIEEVQGWSEQDKEGVRGSNAVRIFGLGV